MLILALGIGPNTVSFSLADALLFRPLDVPKIDRVQLLYGARTDIPNHTDELSPADFEDLRRQATRLDHVSAFNYWSANLTGTGDPERVQGFQVTGDFFLALGVPALLGRTLLPGEDSVGRDDVLVLSYNLWMRRFGGAPDIVGRRIEVNGRPYQVVGVMPKSMQFPWAVELWAPLTFTSQDLARRGVFYLNALGRMQKGVNREQAEEELRAIGARLASEHPTTHKGRTLRGVLLREQVSGNMTKPYTWMTIAATLLVLLLACVNVALLQLARGGARLREFALRFALGATRLRLIRQLLVESSVLGLLGALGGVLLAIWGLDLIRAALPAEVEKYLPGWSRVGINPLLLAVTLCLSVERPPSHPGSRQRYRRRNWILL